MPAQEDQPSLLERIRSLSQSIFNYQSYFDSGKYNTYGGAQALQGMKAERKRLQGELDPIRLIATGISCRDCKHFMDDDGPDCVRALVVHDGPVLGTSIARTEGPCGPEARLFEPVAAHA